MPAFNLENLQLLFSKTVLLLFVGLILLVMIKVLHSRNLLKKLEAYKSVATTYFLLILFLVGFYFTSRNGDIFFASLYPLYISIVIASIYSVKHRSQEIDSVDQKYLLQELKWGITISFISLGILIPLNLNQFLAQGIIFALNLLLLGFIFNLSLIYKTYKKNKK